MGISLIGDDFCFLRVLPPPHSGFTLWEEHGLGWDKPGSFMFLDVSVPWPPCLGSEDGISVPVGGGLDKTMGCNALTWCLQRSRSQ